MSESMGRRGGGAREGVLWGALLLQARANCTRAEANLRQPKANGELSHNLFMSTQNVFGKDGTIDLEPDRLESWYSVTGDAVNGCSIAVLVTRRPRTLLVPTRSTARKTHRV
eukprot:GHVU01159427.1.p1 GENE.GHVU01159427.1~~GHVU01159427.1.p1  ORF type:complete len:112 (+),score=2.18 GHVU01159427.1:162-497(+)